MIETITIFFVFVLAFLGYSCHYFIEKLKKAKKEIAELKQDHINSKKELEDSLTEKNERITSLVKEVEYKEQKLDLKNNQLGDLLVHLMQIKNVHEQFSKILAEHETSVYYDENNDVLVVGGDLQYIGQLDD